MTETSLDRARKAMLEAIEQSLLERMADFLDGEELQLNEAIMSMADPVERTESELHIRMAKAAFKEYKKTIKSTIK
jgi:hypothetical protein